MSAKRPGQPARLRRTRKPPAPRLTPAQWRRETGAVLLDDARELAPDAGRGALVLARRLYERVPGYLRLVRRAPRPRPHGPVRDGTAVALRTVEELDALVAALLDARAWLESPTPPAPAVAPAPLLVGEGR